MAINIKFTKFDNTSWGFRLAGGSDFPQPLTVIRVTEGGLAECMGLKVGDVVVRLNDQPVSSLTHGQAHEEIVRAGNNFVLAVQRGEDSLKAVEALAEENIVPYKIPLVELPPIFPEEILKEETVIEKYEEETRIEERSGEEEIKPEVEPLPEKPKDANSEIVPNENLTDDEIAQLILEEEELLSDQGVLGVNFKKLKPRAPILRESKVLEELQHIATSDPPQVEELKRTSVFLQKPQRPVPCPRKKEEPEDKDVETYRVVIKKQQRRSITDRLLERGLLRPEEKPKTPDPPITPEATPSATPSATPDPGCRSDQERDSRPTSKAESKQEENEVESVAETSCREDDEKQEVQAEEPRKEEKLEAGSVINDIEKEMAKLASQMDKEKIKELVTTEINLEKQLENVQRQLLALKQLPSEIESHLRIVSDQLQKIMELSGVQNGATNEEDRRETCARRQEFKESDDELVVTEETEEQDVTEYTEERTYSALSDDHPRIIEPSEDDEEETETQELEGTLSVKSMEEEGNRVKKFIVSYETKIIRSRDPSPAPSYGSFEPDPKLSPKDQVIQELQDRMQKRGRKRSQDLWPQAKQLELTLGRRWRCPNDFFNDEMIAEVLSSQAEVIRGSALGVNFKKYEKTNLPNYDHLMNSSVYKMIHKMEKEPRKGIPARPAKVNAAEDILERAKSPALSVADDRSTRSVSH